MGRHTEAGKSSGDRAGRDGIRPVSVSFRISAEEMEQATREVLHHGSARGLLVGMALALAAGGLLAFTVLDRGTLGAPFVFAGSMIVIYRRTLLQRLARYYLSRDPAVPGKRTYTFRDDGVAVNLPHVKGVLGWDVWSKVVETDDFYLFVVRGRFPSPIPKRAFASAQDEERFRAQVRRHVRRVRLAPASSPSPPS